MASPNTNLTEVTSFEGQSRLQQQLAQFRNGQAIPRVTARNASAAQPSVQQNIINSLLQGFDLGGNTLEAAINNAFSQSNIPQGFADTRRGLVQGQAVPPTFPAASSAIPQANLNNATGQSTVLGTPTPPQSPAQGTGLALANTQPSVGGTAVPLDTRGFDGVLGQSVDTSFNLDVGQTPQGTNLGSFDIGNFDPLQSQALGNQITSDVNSLGNEAGFFDNLEFGDIATGLNTLANVGGLFLGFEQLSLGQEQLAFQRDSFEAQFAEQRQLLQEARNRRSAITAAVAT